jgi:phosphoglycolate phosphatase-like HAD superfamily hydrolase
MLKGIIFDFDGVIVESLDIKTKAFGKLFESYGDLSRKMVEYHLEHTGVPRYEKFRYFYNVLLEQEIDDKTMNFLDKEFSKIVKEEIIKAPFVNGVLEFLDNYYGKIDFFIASATPERELLDIVESKGLKKYFKGIHGYPPNKVENTARIIDRGYSREELIFVGDAKSDYNAAKENGLRFVLRKTADNKNLNVDYDFVIENFHDLQKIVEEELDARG